MRHRATSTRTSPAATTGGKCSATSCSRCTGSTRWCGSPTSSFLPRHRACVRWSRQWGWMARHARTIRRRYYPAPRRKRAVAARPLAFGEGNIKTREKRAALQKKPAFCRGGARGRDRGRVLLTNPEKRSAAAFVWAQKLNAADVASIDLRSGGSVYAGSIKNSIRKKWHRQSN